MQTSAKTRTTRTVFHCSLKIEIALATEPGGPRSERPWPCTIANAVSTRLNIESTIARHAEM